MTWNKELEEEREEVFEEVADEEMLCEEQPAKMSRKKKILLGVGLGFAGLAFSTCIAAGGYIGLQVAKTPDVDLVDISPDGYLSVIEDTNGEKIHSLYSTESNRIHVPLSATPEYLQKAFVAIEDARFYTHHGVDVKGIARAAFKGIASGGHFTEGASTLTQQLLKNNVFEGWMGEQTFGNRLSRKIQEQCLAIQVEKKYSKDWILENYMNTINLGGGTRGVQVASQFYFGKDVSELSLAESALIAGITKNPSGYNPKEHPEKSLERQHLVLDAMESHGYITAEEKQAALEEDVIGHLDYEHAQNTKALSWFEDALLVSVVQDLMEQKGMSEEEAWDLIYAGGLTIHSTQNSALQAICEEAVNRPDFVQDTEQISVVVTDVETGAVAAIVGGRGEKDSSLVYNRATDSVCQPGSTIKIIGEYAAALDQGMTTLGSTWEDAPYTYSDGTELHNANQTYAGKTTLRQAISSSCNVIALKMLQTTGIEMTTDYLKRFGITTLTQDDYQEALAIGGTYNGITNLEMTGAYNAIAADGQYVRPYFYTKVTDYKGETILENVPERTEAVSANTAKLLTLGMEEVIRTGTGTAVYCDGMELAGKSGTTNDFRDVWFVGFSSAYTCGVWGGHDDNSPQNGSGHVKDIWRTIMEQTPAVSLADYSRPLVDTSDLVVKIICTKCGKLAIADLCDQTVQGDMTAAEYYVPGTEPVGYCDCHVRISLCSESSMRSSRYCPEECKHESVFLKDAAPGTEDENYTASWLSSETCNVHTSAWKKLQEKIKKVLKHGDGGDTSSSDDEKTWGDGGNTSSDDEKERTHEENEAENHAPVYDYFQNLFGSGW
ncbi:MAG: transglycosylase domain-containing protein [Lachnospiraceae bacterium]|nr:transglycosylase domain-containing protein [Lachnospiraceae bacterium]